MVENDKCVVHLIFFSFFLVNVWRDQMVQESVACYCEEKT